MTLSINWQVPISHQTNVNAGKTLAIIYKIRIKFIKSITRYRKFCIKIRNILKPIDLSRSQHTELGRDYNERNEFFSKYMAERSKLLVERVKADNNPLFWQEYLETQSLIYQKAGELLEKRQQLLAYVQTRTNLSQREQQALKNIIKLSADLSSDVLRFSNSIDGILSTYHSTIKKEKDRFKQWVEEEFQHKEVHLIIERYPHILSKLQQMPDGMPQKVLEMSEENLGSLAYSLIGTYDSLKEQRKDEYGSREQLDKDLETFYSHLTNSDLPQGLQDFWWWALQMRKENLDKLANNCGHCLDGYQQMQHMMYKNQPENNSRVKLSKALERFCSDLTNNSDLSQVDHAKLERSKTMLENWYKEQNNNAKIESIEKQEKAYNDREKGTTSNSSQAKGFKWLGLF